MSLFRISLIGFLLLFHGPAFSQSRSQVQKSALRSSQFDSYNEVWRQVSMNPWQEHDQWGRPNQIPKYQGVSTGDLLELMKAKFKSLFNKDADMSEWKVNGSEDFAQRSRALFTNSANFKEPRVKWLHPRGVCAKAEWSITEHSPATGLFANGTRVPVVIRFSSGTEASERIMDNKLQTRIFGMAIKLFHESDKDRKAITSNIISLDQNGFSRSSRPYMLYPAANEDLYFTNVAPVENIFGSKNPILTGAGKVLSWALDLFDSPNFARPVYVSASYDDKGREVSDAVTPYKLKFIPHFKKPKKLYDDFRLELLSYKAGKIDIVISQMNEEGASADQKIGEMQISEPMLLTHNCDLRLSFHHSPVIWKQKYEDKNLSIDKL